MAHTTSNSDRSEWTVGLLHIDKRDRVLEIGFGPGLAIERVSRIATEGLTVGVDHSEVMVRQATRRNREAVASGRVKLLLGSASELPSFDEPFDKIFTINSIHFWDRPVDCLGELRKLLKPGGQIAVTIQPRSRGATRETVKILGDELAANLKRAGFVDCRQQVSDDPTVSAVCVLGTRQDDTAGR